MKSIKASLLSVALMAAVPITAAAFGFGAAKQDGPWGGYGPYGAYAPPGYAPPAFPPPGPPPGARDVRGMFGSGPGMSWGDRERNARELAEKRAIKPYQKLREPWQWSRPWPSSPWYSEPRRKPAAAETPAEPVQQARQPRPNFGSGWGAVPGQAGKFPPGWERYQDSANDAVAPTEAPGKP